MARSQTRGVLNPTVAFGQKNTMLRGVKWICRNRIAAVVRASAGARASSLPKAVDGVSFLALAAVVLD